MEWGGTSLSCLHYIGSQLSSENTLRSWSYVQSTTWKITDMWSYLRHIQGWKQSVTHTSQATAQPGKLGDSGVQTPSFVNKRAPAPWNSLPQSLREVNSVELFRKKLKTYSCLFVFIYFYTFLVFQMCSTVFILQHNVFLTWKALNKLRLIDGS